MLIVEPATRRVFSLGPSTQTARLPLLVLQGCILVLWQRDDGRLVLTQLPN